MLHPNLFELGEPHGKSTNIVLSIIIYHYYKYRKHYASFLLLLLLILLVAFTDIFIVRLVRLFNKVLFLCKVVLASNLEW